MQHCPSVELITKFTFTSLDVVSHPSICTRKGNIRRLPNISRSPKRKKTFKLYTEICYFVLLTFWPIFFNFYPDCFNPSLRYSSEYIVTFIFLNFVLNFIITGLVCLTRCLVGHFWAITVDSFPHILYFALSLWFQCIFTINVYFWPCIWVCLFLSGFVYFYLYLYLYLYWCWHFEGGDTRLT